MMFIKGMKIYLIIYLHLVKLAEKNIRFGKLKKQSV
jgi:hypothetical protein